jgi:hypothetical protein
MEDLPEFEWKFQKENKCLSWEKRGRNQESLRKALILWGPFFLFSVILSRRTILLWFLHHKNTRFFFSFIVFDPISMSFSIFHHTNINQHNITSLSFFSFSLSTLFSIYIIWLFDNERVCTFETQALFQGRPKGKAAQARALGPPKIYFFYEGFRPQKNSMKFVYI